MDYSPMVSFSLLLREYKAEAYQSVSELTELHQRPESLLPLSESGCSVTYGSTLRTSTPITRFKAHPWDDM
ncbi:hypothetical protein Tco_0840305 [Tanacetum coccineum]|uniref:Uncharacterized protein n=1 Tax=Tanacetum coccineum TaxID=301880 RepID=A0ABQ5AU21_9ASTR